MFLGSTCIQPGRFNALGTIIAVYFVAVIVNGLTLAGAAAWVNSLFNGLALRLRARPHPAN
jgi:ribose transport system permease protein